MAQTEFTKIWEQGAEAERNKILGQLLIANNKPRDTGNPLNDMTGIGGGKPLPKGTPAPKEMQLPIPGVDWRKFLVDLMINPEIASGPYRDNKAGNVDEVWDLTGPKFIGPMPKSFYDAVDKIRMSLPIRKADASAGSEVLKGLPRNRGGSHRDALKSGDLTPEHLIKTLKIAAPLFNQASHDNRQFKSVPATGVRGDQPAGQEWKDLLIDETLLQTQKRLKA